MLSFELHCLSTPYDNINEFSNLLQDSPCKDTILLLLQQKYESCLQLCKRELNFDSIEQLPLFLQSFCRNSKANEQEITLFCCGVSCLQLFVQRNWLGPFAATNHPWQNDVNNEIEMSAREVMQQDSNTVPKTCQLLPYLVIAEAIFEFLAGNTFFETSYWWLLRCYSVHSHVLNEHSEALFNKSTGVIEQCLLPTFLNETVNKSYLLQLNLEIGILLLYYYQYKQADTHFEQANMLSGVKFNLTGAMGVRTKFQQKSVAQLLIEVERKEGDKLLSKVFTDHSNVPKDLSLNDDTLLEKIKFSEDNETVRDLSLEELSTLLVKCTYMQKTCASHKLQQEEIGALIQYLLSCKSCWCIQNNALRIRSGIEKERSRLVERCMMQMELLVNLVTKEDENARQRLELFYSVFSPPIWEMEGELAKLFRSLGATNAAMDIYKRLSMWEEAICCLIHSDRADEARDMLQYHLKHNETPNLWCLFGDLQREPKHYLKAWELSKHRSYRAMKSLGAYHVSKRQFEEAVECFDKSLAILSLQTGTWFTLGCSCLALENFQRAANAFRRCVSLNWDNFEAWSNLAASYIKYGKKKEAFKALAEAVKCNFDKWQLWENYLVVGIDVGRFNEAMTAYTRLLEIKQKHVDVEILQTLVRVVIEDIPCATEQPGSTLKPKLLKLFGHVTSKVSSEYEIWQLYAKLCGMGLGDDTTENAKALQHLHKALRVGLQKSGWEKNEKTIEKYVEMSDGLEKGCDHCVESLDAQTLSSIRLTLKGFSVKLKQREKLMLETSDQENMSTFAQKVEDSADRLKQLVSKKKSL